MCLSCLHIHCLAPFANVAQENGHKLAHEVLNQTVSMVSRPPPPSPQDPDLHSGHIGACCELNDHVLFC